MFRSSPFLSIIVPVYNVAPYVGPCLESIYDGSVNEDSFEVIIINDGSTDGSATVIDGFTALHGNIQVITQENQGLSMARMNGLARARGAYVWFVDSDDYLAPQAVTDLLSLIQAPDAPSVLMTPVHRLDIKTGTCHPDYEIDAPRLMEGMDILLDKQFPIWTVSRYVIRRSLFENRNLFFPKGLIHEDEYFGAVLMTLAGKVLVHDKAVFFHRTRPGSIMQTISIRSSYDYVSNYALLKAFSETLPDTSRDDFLRYSQRLLPISYTVNEPIWQTREFHRFKCKKGPFMLCEFIRSHRLYSRSELTALAFLVLAPNAFRKRFPNK